MAPFDLIRTLSWKSAGRSGGDDLTMLRELQANIVRAHVRSHMSVMLLQFRSTAEGRAFLKALVTTGLIKSAWDHVREVENFEVDGRPGTPYVGVGISARGYKTLGLGAVPTDSSFARGMQSAATRENLKDPPPTVWEAPYQEEIHAVVVVGDASEAAMVSRRNVVLALVTSGIRVLTEEIGHALENESKVNIEHFGYVDGRSQPLFLEEDIIDERARAAGTLLWDPALELSGVLVPDDAAPDPRVHHGSYLVFRKLEQNVRLFKQAEEDLADALGLPPSDRERAGAMLVGRFEDGTPLVLQDRAAGLLPVTNNFTYVDDKDGVRCPFQAHTRKVNPRTARPRDAIGENYSPIMARRGVPYGDRSDDPNADLPPEKRPSRGVGLLFMAFNADIKKQFEAAQGALPDTAVTAARQVGIDPLIGQGARPAKTSYPRSWDAAGMKDVTSPPQAVTMKGGEYFFAPSLAFLRSL